MTLPSWYSLLMNQYHFRDKLKNDINSLLTLDNTLTVDDILEIKQLNHIFRDQVQKFFDEWWSNAKS